jgi:hypothetical protein
MRKINSHKKLLYFSICFIAVLSIYIFLQAIKPYNKKFNQNLLSNSLTLLYDHLDEINKFRHSEGNLQNSLYSTELSNINFGTALNNVLLPFSINFITDEKGNDLSIKYDSEKNILNIIFNKNSYSEQELSELINIISKFSILEKIKIEKQNSTNDANTNISNKKLITYLPTEYLNNTKIYKSINIWLLTQEETIDKIDQISENLFRNLIISQLQQSGISIYVKYLFYQTRDVKNVKDFYSELKKLNGKNVFEELNDENSINLILNDDKENFGEIYNNKDINNDIYNFDFESLNIPKGVELISDLVFIRTLHDDLKNSFTERINNLPKKMDILREIVAINNSDAVNFYKYLIISLNDLEKVNKFLPNYETIRTFDKVKEKVIFLISFF